MLAFLAGRLEAARLEEAEEHLDGCGLCREAVAVVAAVGTGAEPRPRPKSAARLRPGTRLDRYLLEGTLGQGAMGVVYAARDVVLDRRVAIKIPGLHEASAADGFRREAQAMARLSHRNVVTVYCLGALPGGAGVYIAMELIAGVTARRRIEEHALPWRSALRIFVEAGQGLLAAHEVGLVHRDFKPDNVLVGDDGRVCVSDFGLSVPARATGPGSLAGSPAYMAPEQMGGGPIDARTDVFAFSVSVYEAVYGVRPFAGRTLAALDEEIRAGRFSEPSRGGDLPRPVGEAIRAGLRGEPGERPQLSELVAELRRAHSAFSEPS
ncbi:MAG TPA: serine/threonine-protein kinase [Solirubrobacter sp.]